MYWVKNAKPLQTNELDIHWRWQHGQGILVRVCLSTPPCAYAQVHARTPGVRCVRGVRVRVHVCPTPGHHPQRKLHAIMAIDLELHPATLKCMCVLHTRLNPKTKP